MRYRPDFESAFHATVPEKWSFLGGCTGYPDTRIPGTRGMDPAPRGPAHDISTSVTEKSVQVSCRSFFGRANPITGYMCMSQTTIGTGSSTSSMCILLLDKLPVESYRWNCWSQIVFSKLWGPTLANIPWNLWKWNPS